MSFWSQSIQGEKIWHGTENRYGRICLVGLVMFGLGGMAGVYVLFFISLLLPIFSAVYFSDFIRAQV